MAVNPHKIITDRILDELRAGAAPWIKPWSNGKRARPVSFPVNPTTGNRYRGVNVFMLWSAAVSRGWEDWRFMTFKQAKGMGAAVRKGERGEKVVFVSQFEREGNMLDASGKPVMERVPFLKQYTVFNVDQIDGLPDDLGGDNRTTSIDGEFGQFITATGADIRHGGQRAFHRYDPYDRSQIIQMPHAADFHTLDGYRHVLLHELTHWTGTPSRLDRKIFNPKGSKDYAFEELVAELGAALLCAEFGVVGDLRHAGYIQTWIKLLEDNERAFVSAASKAQKAVDYLRELAIAIPASKAA